MFIMVAMSVLVFLATHALPSNAAALILGQYSTHETQAALEHKLGFDQPLPVQYWRWASHMLQGDMGQSFEMERPVAPILWDALGRSAILAMAAMAVVSTLGLTLGVVAAVWRGRWPDHVASILIYFGVSLPEFYLGLVFITVLAQDFGFLIGGIVAVETVFAYPGLGRMLVGALERQDLPLMQAAILVLTGAYCLANLTADLLYGVANPRIRYGGAID
jgi:ABC-type dipeptide/oligopeptide/nickel transport system permease component